MARFKLIIFDLDDVLYSEIDYVRSGFKAVASSISDNKYMQKKLFLMMMKLFNNDPKHVFDNLIKIYDLNTDLETNTKDSLIKIYREHLPKIKLNSKVLTLLKKIKNESIFMAILSDGRKNSQELKIKSLGLENIMNKIILTDSLGPRKKFWKPNTYGFKLLLNHFKVEANQACYIGDNLNKDFIAPEKLGMITILFKKKNGLYNLKNQNENQCNFIVNSISELKNLIFD